MSAGDKTLQSIWPRVHIFANSVKPENASFLKLLPDTYFYSKCGLPLLSLTTQFSVYTTFLQEFSPFHVNRIFGLLGTKLLNVYIWFRGIVGVFFFPKEV